MFHEPTYIWYRQPEFTNFFLGRDGVRAPTEAERSKAEAGAVGRPVWPAPGAVYLDGDSVVVVLEPP